MFLLHGLASNAGGLVTPQERCDVAVAGGGPGGIYFAWRLLKAGTDKNVCIYEQSDRFGGRIFSLRKQGPKADLVVDLGAYRYAPEPYQEGDWYIYTPLLGGLIDEALKLPSSPYEPGNPKSTVRKIVDAAGQNAGYATFVEAMYTELTTKYSSQFKLTFNQELVSISPPVAGAAGAAAGGSTVSLAFASGLTVAAGKVLLNLPQLPLLKVLDNSEALLGASGGMPPSLQVPTPMDGVKLYVHYANAWWKNLLNKTSGEFGPNIHNATMLPLRQLPDLSGRYHDGHTRCDGPGHTQCRGFLEATYTYAMGARFFLNHEPSAEPPYTRLLASKPSGKFALNLVHEVLVQYHKLALDRLSKDTGQNMVRARGTRCAPPNCARAPALSPSLFSRAAFTPCLPVPTLLFATRPDPTDRLCGQAQARFGAAQLLGPPDQGLRRRDSHDAAGPPRGRERSGAEGDGALWRSSAYLRGQRGLWGAAWRGRGAGYPSRLGGVLACDG